ncbi:MAG: ABC transporter ATP-binding protein [Alsobacter sp.]
MSVDTRPSLLALEHLTVGLGREARTLVQDVSLAIAAGESLALVGESGSGKSITALAVMGLLPHGAHVTKGRILFNGTDLRGLAEGELRRHRGKGLGMIFQEPMTSLNPVLTIGLQMTEGLRLHKGLDDAAASREARTMLDRVGIDQAARRMGQYPHEFSGGMRQRVMIAAAMALRPRLLIADEPTTALDVTVQAQILDLMRDVTKEAGTSLLLITHDMGVVAEIADRVAVMNRGRIVEQREVKALFDAPQDDYTKRLLAAVPRIDGAGVHEPGPALDREPILRLEAISKSFGAGRWGFGSARQRVLDDVSLSIRSGETLALVGESGSGKSTLGRIAVRLTEPDSGRIILDGADVTTARGAELRRLRDSIQIIFQDPFSSLDPTFSVERTIAEPLRIRGGFPGEEIRKRVAALLARVALPPGAGKRLPHEFSGGQRQRIAIARALAVGPEIIVADEPTSALDVSVQATILDLLAELQAETRLAMLFITHDLAVVRKIAHRVAVMRAGRIVELGPADAILGAPLHPYTRALISAAPVPDPSRRRPPRAALTPPGPPVALNLVAPNHWVAA